MSGLSAWQQSLSIAIETGGAGETVAAWGLSAVSVDGGADAVAIYRSNSLGTRQLALEAVYPVCQRLVGKACFRGLAREFVRCHPSSHPNLNRFGAGFAELLDEVLATLAAFARLPWLADLARLEWLCHWVKCQADDQPLNLAGLQTANAHRFRPRPSRSLAWLRTARPVPDLWQAHLTVKAPPAMRVDPDDWCLVAERRDGRARIQVTDAGILDLLDNCAAGAKIGEIAEDLRSDAEVLDE
ncbi:MAG: DNA-binding domain-containing protein [Gammaproteobacteria bacterium]|nr:DNA-binding domain-containing protein [Gammaproteobacteria bacterium]